MLEASQVTGVLLAGGRSQRMGTDKAWLKIGDQTFASRILSLLQLYFREVLISANNPEGYERFNLPVVADIYANRGPLAGIHSALLSAKNDYIFVAPCDMPIINGRVVEKILLNACENSPTIASADGELYPLLGVYPKLVQKNLEEFLDSSYSNRVHDFLGNLPVSPRLVDLSEESFLLKNITTPADYEALLSYLRLYAED